MVELLVASVILALCVVPITGTLSFLRTNAAQARVESQVYARMQSLLAARLDGGKLFKLVQSLVPSTTNAMLDGGTTVTYTVTVTAVSGYKNLFAIACTASWTPLSTASRTDTASLTTYAVTI